MILYNTLLGVCAGLGMILFARFLKTIGAYENIGHDNEPDARGFGLSFVIVGAPLTVLSFLMTAMWPLTANPPINIAFAEPSVLLGILLLAAGIILLRHRPLMIDIKPVLWIIFSLGIMLAFISSAVFSYDLVGDAPSAEPITGQFTGWENTTFGLAYAVAALGCLFSPLAMKHTWAQRIVIWSFTLSGVFFLLFSLLNYRTHIGLLINLEHGTDYRW